MTISTTIETAIINELIRYGATVTIQKQTATYDTYHQRTPNWTNGTTVDTNAIIVPFRARSGSGEEWHLTEEGAIQEADYVGFFKATETLEESSTTTTATRYIIVYNAQNYEIIQIKPIEFQDNVVLKRCVLRLITS